MEMSMKKPCALTVVAVSLVIGTTPALAIQCRNGVPIEPAPPECYAEEQACEAAAAASYENWVSWCNLLPIGRSTCLSAAASSYQADMSACLNALASCWANSCT